jgi:hypothetical protein
MARQNETSSAPDRHSPVTRKELRGSIRRGTDWGGSTEQSSAIPQRNTTVTKENRKTGRKG